MDELVAAAAVAAMDVDSGNIEDALLEMTDDTPGANTRTAPASGCAAEDKENYTDPPVDRRPGTTNPKVRMHPRRLQSPPYPQPERLAVLRYLNEISETVAGLPYSLWALPDCSWWLGWLVWLVRLWGTQNTRSLHLEIFRFTIRVSVGPSPKPPTRHVGACAPLYGPL